VVGYKGGEKKLNDFFGKSGGRGEMMMVGDNPAVLAASGYASYLYTRDAADWRDHDLFKFDDTNATSLVIENKTCKFSFTKGDKWAGTLDGKPIANFDDSKVADAVRAFKALSAEGFADATKSLADTGLEKPEGVVTVALKDNAGTYTLRVGSVSTGSSHFAAKAGDATIVTVNPSVSSWALADASKFQKPTDAGAPKADAGKPAAPKAPKTN
jgi:hypothetical protein